MYVAGNCGNQAFQELRGQLGKTQAFPIMPKQLRKDSPFLHFGWVWRPGAGIPCSAIPCNICIVKHNCALQIKTKFLDNCLQIG